MDWSSIVPAAVTSLLVSGGAWKLVQSYIAKAVDYRLQKEIERYKSQLALELERERQLAAQDLERFKSELALPAELRRQLASKKLEALLALVAEGEPFMRKAFNAPPRDPLQTDLLNRIIEKLHTASIYMDKETVKQLWKYITEVQMAKAELDTATQQLDAERAVAKMGAATERAFKAYDAFMDLVRKELGIALARPSSPLAIQIGDTPGDAGQ